MRTHLIDLLWKHRWLAFILMGLFFLLFGAMTVNIFVLLKANIDLFLDYGTMVITDGALLQLAELTAYGYLSMLFYTLFKTCEHILVAQLTGERRASRMEVRGTAEQSGHPS
jgi:hypothetical protein